MAQHDYVIANGTGAAVRSDLNNALAAIVSQNSGATAPATTYAYQFWADTTTGLLKLRNSANSAWITLFQLDGEWSTLPVENGTAAAPSIYFKDSGTDTGFYSPGTDQVAISTGGTGRLFINSSGSVGIGTSSPAALLHVLDSSSTTTTPLILRNYAASVNTKVRIALQGQTASNQGANAFIQSLSGTDAGGSNSNNDSGLQFIVTNGGGATENQAMTINTQGRVGIGTATPSAKLEVSGGNIRLDNNQGVEWGGANNYIYGNESTDFIAITTNGNERARIDSSGRWLLGTSSARTNFENSTFSAAVQVEGTDYAGSRLALIRNGGGGGINLCATGGASVGSNTAVSSGAGLGEIVFAGSDGSEFVNAASITSVVDGTPGANDMPGRLVFSTTKDGQSSPTEAMRITQAGKLILNDTSTAASARFGITSDLNNDNAIVIKNSATQGAGQYFALFYNSAGAAAGSISHSGTTAVAFNTSSDYRLKENVTAVNDGISRLQQLKPCRFNFITDPAKTVDGFIAHEVQAVVPEAITGKKDAVDNDGKPVYQGIDQSKLVPLLTAALQEAIGEIESLKARVASLESA